MQDTLTIGGMSLPNATFAEALAAAPEAEDGRFRVPRILGEEA